MNSVPPRRVLELPFRYLAVCLFLIVSGLTGCSSNVGQTGESSVEDYNANPLTVTVPANVSAGDLQAAINETFGGRGWEVMSSSPEQVVGHLNHRGFDSTVTMVNDGSVVTILNDSTKYNSRTEVTSPGVPMGWLTNLKNDLTVKLN